MNNNYRRLTAAIFLAGLAVAMPAAAQQGKGDPVLATEYSETGADTCLMCHTADDFFKTKHAQRADPRTPLAGAQCETCHGPGGKHAKGMAEGKPEPMLNFGAKSKHSAAVQNKPCLSCHERDARVAWKGSEHEVGDVACASCHKVHTTRNPVFMKEQAEVCYTCHLRQRTDFNKPYAHPVRYGTVRCSDCHNPHGTGTSGRLLNKQTLNQTCYSCHAEKRGPLLWEHAPVSEDCTACHSPHGSVHTALLKKPAPLLCQQCHSPAGHPSVAYTAQGLPGGTPSGFLLAGSCTNCHTQVHGSNHPSGARLMR